MSLLRGAGGGVGHQKALPVGMGGNERVVDRQTRYEDAEAESEAEGNEVDLFSGLEKTK